MLGSCMYKEEWKERKKECKIYFSGITADKLSEKLHEDFYTTPYFES